MIFSYSLSLPLLSLDLLYITLASTLAGLQWDKIKWNMIQTQFPIEHQINVRVPITIMSRHQISLLKLTWKCWARWGGWPRSGGWSAHSGLGSISHREAPRTEGHPLGDGGWRYRGHRSRRHLGATLSTGILGTAGCTGSLRGTWCEPKMKHINWSFSNGLNRRKNFNRNKTKELVILI